MLARALGQAIQAMLKALLMLVLAALILLSRGLQAAFVLARPGLQLGSAALAGYGGFALFRSVLEHYGGDPPALLLALLSVVIVPAFLISSRAEGFGIWAVLLLSGALMMLAHYVIERAPPLLLAAVPAFCLIACVMYLLTRPPQEPPGTHDQIEKENEHE